MPLRPAVRKTSRRMLLCSAVVGLLALSPGDLAAVPGPLDDAHKPLTTIYRELVRHEIRIDRGMQYLRTAVRYPQVETSANWKLYIRGLVRYNGSKIKSSPTPDRKAFWINTYNSLVIKALAAALPSAKAGGTATAVNSIPGLLSTPHPVGGVSITLSDVERSLREFQDPRVWLAVSQGAVSSPALPREPYNPTDLEDQLDQAAANFLADPLKFAVDRDQNRIFLSDIFRARALEFSEAGLTVPASLLSYPSDQRSVLAFILPRIRSQDREYILEKKPTIEYRPFDWSLNLAR